MLIKSKLSQRDLDEVLRILKSNDNSMMGFAQYDNSCSRIHKSENNNNNNNKSDMKKSSSIQQKENHVNAKATSISNEPIVDLDTTLVIADNSSNNLNTSN